MSANNKYCMVHYRKLARGDGQFPDFSLAEAIATAMSSSHRSGQQYSKNWKLRTVADPRNETSRRFINDYHSDEIAVFGTICVFTPGEMQALLEVDPKNASDRAPIEAVDIAEDRAPNGHEYLRGIAYWLAIKDHFFIIQHPAIQAKALEEYLTWFFREELNIINNNQFVSLSAAFDIASMGGDLDEIKSIQIGGIIPEVTNLQADTAEPGVVRLPTTEVVERTLMPGISAAFEKGRKILEDLLGTMKASQIIEKIPDDAHLEVKVNIGYKSRRRKLNSEFMQDLASGLRNLPDGDIRIVGKDGIIRGDEARLQMPMPINRLSESSSLLDLIDARDKMLKVYSRFVEDGKITP